LSKIDKILKKKRDKLNPVYLIYGSERYLLENFLEKFLDRFVPDEIRGFNLTFLEDDDTNFVSKMKSMVYTLPTMSPKRFVIARCNNFFKSKNSQDEDLINVFDDFPEKTILLLLVNGKIDKRIKVNKTVKKIGNIVELNPPKYNNLDQWIKNRFNDYDKKVGRKAIKLLEEMFNNNLQRLEKEIEKIVTHSIDQELIRYEDIRDVISRDRLLKDNIIFSLTDALSEKKKNKAISTLNEMMNSGDSSLMILAMIVRQLRLLLQVKVLKKKGNNYKKIAKILKQHPYPIKKCYSQGDNFTEDELELLLERFLKANHDIVTGKYSNKKMALELALLDL
jgi:DNA polymerase-3 subunit delta